VERIGFSNLMCLDISSQLAMMELAAEDEKNGAGQF
jgi:hypothetical protein